MNDKRGRGLSGATLLVCVILLFAALWFTNQIDQRDKQITYQEFESLVESGEVSEVTIVQNRDVPTGRLEITAADAQEGDEAKQVYVSDVNEVQDYLAEHDVTYTLRDVPQENWFMTNIFPVLLILAAFFLFFYMMNRQNGGANAKAMSFGKSRARMSTEQDKKITFAQVAGLQEEKEELEEIVDFLKAPKKYIQVGARIPKGVLLVGPPGTGKTLLAKAVAGEAGVPFFSISGSDFVEMFVGVGASRVRDLFEDAKKNAPCIIFIDEIDAVARRRGTGMGGGHDEREQILKVHAKGKPLGDDVDLQQIAQTTAGFTGADLENLLNEAAILAAKDDRVYLQQSDIRKAFVKVGIGAEKKSRVISDKEKKITAYHEAGHAILFHVLPDVGPVYSVSIIPTGTGAAGYTMPLPERDEMFNTKGKMLQDITVALGGRVAEEEIFNDITTGASQDIKQATSLAKSMVTKFGMSEKLGLVNYDNDSDEVFIGRDLAHTSRGYGEQVASTIDQEVRDIIDACYRRAKYIIRKYQGVLEKCAQLLLEKEKITREEFESLFDGIEVSEI